jgi:hypothetical protein
MGLMGCDRDLRSVTLLIDTELAASAGSAVVSPLLGFRAWGCMYVEDVEKVVVLEVSRSGMFDMMVGVKISIC